MFDRALLKWTEFVVSHAAAVLVVMFSLTAGAAWIAVSFFSINSNTERLIHQDTEWRSLQDRFEAKFPQYTHTTFVVVSGSSWTRVGEVARALEERLRAHDEYFEDVYAPANSQVLRDHALLYLDVDTLDDTISRLAEAQPILASIQAEPNLHGILGVITDTLQRSTNGALATDLGKTGFQEVIRSIDRFTRQVNSGEQPSLSLQDRFLERDKTWYNIIFVRGKLDFDETLPSAHILENIRAAIDDLDLPASGDVEVRLTGKIPLEHGEIVSAMNSARLAGTVAFILLSIVLVYGVRSLRVILAVYLSLLVGLIWTAALAPFTVGEFNTISIIFLVMFIGLGVDFAIHLSLRYQEDLLVTDKRTAIIQSTMHIGPALMLCGLSSAIGFFSFVPTEYTGLAEMGIISGSGMLLAIVITFTLIPAFFAVTRPPDAASALVMAERTATWLIRWRAPILTTALVLSLAAVWLAKDVSFDFSNLALRDPNSEAMRTLQELQDENVITDYAMQYVASDAQRARSLKQELTQLPAVKDVLLPGDYLPDHQDDKIALLGDAQLLLEGVFMPAPPTRELTPAERIATVRSLGQAIDRYIAANPETDLVPTLRSLATSMRQALEDDRLAQLETQLAAELTAEVDWLKKVLYVSPLTFADLPRAMRDRLIDDDGEFLLTILPAEDMSDPRALHRFTDQVKAVVPEATGRAPIEIEIGEIVIRAFIEAIAIASLGIGILLYASLRSVLDTIAVFVPLFLTAIFTFAASVLLKLPLNMANVVVIPLIFGLGVDNGIHVVKRYRETPNFHELLTSSTPRALLLSTLTTLGTFGALSLSSHRGIYSIGVLLTCALAIQLVLTLVVLPVILHTLPDSRPNGQSQP